MISFKKIFRTRKMVSSSILICLFLLLIPKVFGVSGDTGTSGDYNWRELDDGSVVITGYNGLEVDINIPTQLDDKNVSEIGDSVFSGKTFITSVDIPVGITYIGNYAFAGCNSLATITLPNNLKTIGEGAFIQCAMTEILLPEGLEKIEGTAFNNCGLTHITLPSSLKYIGTYAFAACYNLEEVTILSNLTSVGDGIFESCVALTDVRFACDQLPINNSSFFSGCSELKNVEFIGDWTSIWNYAFAGRLSLETVTLPSTLKIIGEGAFIQCAMTEIVLPEGLEYIERTAFNSSGLENVTLPSSLQSIDTYAFAACYSLSKVTILSESTSFGSDIFVSTLVNTDGVYGFEGSTAQDYANINSHPFHNIYTISFDAQNGSSVERNFGIIGQLINEPDIPELIGYAFEGWYPTPDCDTQQVDFPYTVLGDFEMYAKWIPERMINPQTGESNN